MITACEIVQHSPATKEHKAICRQIAVCLNEIFRDCLGDDFKVVLQTEADTVAAAYEADANYQGDFNENVTYTTGQIVKYCGRYYTANADGTTGQIEYPDCSTMWDLQVKFSTACYETMWNDYMVGYLAYAIYLEAIPEINIMEGNGFFRQDTDGTGAKSLDKNWYQSFCRSMADLTAKRLKALKCYIEDQAKAETCDFSTVLFLNNNCDNQTCSEDEKPSRRIAFRY